MTGEERKKLRDATLQTLYEYHFSNNGASFRESRESLRKDIERKLAIDYLIEKGYVREEKQGLDNLLISITAYGIDYIENE